MDRRRGILNAQHEGSDYSSNYLTIEALQDGLTFPTILRKWKNN